MRGWARVFSSFGGWALTEVIVVAAIFAWLVFAAVPAAERWIGRQRVQVVARALQADLALARSIAMQRRTVVTICPSRDGLFCMESAEWAAGWISFVDADRDGQRAASEALLQVRARPASGVVAWLTAADPRYVSYRSNGRAHLRTGAFQAGHWLVCPRHGEAGMRIWINAVGRSRLEEEGVVCS